MEDQVLKPSILYIDDEQDNLDVFRSTFRREYTIYTADSAKKGIEILQQQPVHVIITDQRMPGMTGIAFLETIIPIYPKPTRMILTGYTDIEVVIQAINKGHIFYYVTKPWKENEFRVIINNAIDSFNLRQKNEELNLSLTEANRQLSEYANLLENRVEERTQQLEAKNLAFLQAQQALQQAELERVRLENEKLHNEVTYKSNELASYTLHIVQKNSLLMDLKEAIQQNIKTGATDASSFKRVLQLIDYNFKQDQDWNNFKRIFDQVHADFLNKLKDVYSDLTSADLRLCAMFKMNMNTKEIAAILGISPSSVNIARHRLRKKLRMAHEDDLISFILQFE